MVNKKENKQIIMYFVIAFLGAWVCQFLSIRIRSMYTVLNALCMFAPLIAVLVIKKAVGREATGISWKLEIKKNWKWFLAALLLPSMFTLIGAVIYFLIFPNHFDPAMGYMTGLLPEGQIVSSVNIVILQLITAITYGPFINVFFALGEEAGWRGYMTPFLQKRIGKKAGLIIGGIIWAVWHYPLILFSGYEYGTGYPGAPITGLLAMCIFTTVLGILFSFLYEKTNSIWAPALAHGAINAVAGIPLLFTDGSLKGYLAGPTPAGFISIIPLLILALIVLLRRKQI